MNFQTRKLEEKPPEKKDHKNIKISVGIFTTLLIILVIIFSIFKAITSLDIGFLMKIAGKDIQQDAYGHTNFLFLGNGGSGHDGGDLTDSIIVASLDNNDNKLTLLSIPRDYWVKDSKIGNSKINEVYFNAQRRLGGSTEGLEYTAKKIENIVGVPIHYWVRIDFKGFTEIIDAIGGLEVDIPNNLYDPYYPGPNYGYQAFNIKKGPQTIDGETALKYVRSRKTTSDFDRANRQQIIIDAIKNQALKSDIIFSPKKIGTIQESVQNNLDTNLSIKEILTLGSILKNITSSDLNHRLIHDNSNTCGGLLYTPERQYYNGLYVLIPGGGEKFIHLYSDLNFNYPQIAQENKKIHILNGTKRPGIAGEQKQLLQRLCFNITRFGNGSNIPISETTYYFKGEQRPHSLDFLQKLIPGKETTEIPLEYQEYITEADIIIEIGSDHITSENYLSDPFKNIFKIVKPAAPQAEEQTQTTESTE